MKTMRWTLLAALFCASAASLAACGGNAAKPANTAPTAKARPETPSDFKDKKNPFAGKDDAIKAGGELFKVNCVPCHGPEADGNCDAGKALTPPAGNLRLADLAALPDGYFFWRVSKGGAGANVAGSAMQAFEATLSEDQRWQLIAYLRSLPAK
ncbi:cytochrome c-L [uncultured bacterium]|nr:cytochrome c-L [uncultured bacterium]